eukprot:163001-Chlamydomonas_euryale.AAC.1
MEELRLVMCYEGECAPAPLAEFRATRFSQLLEVRCGGGAEWGWCRVGRFSQLLEARRGVRRGRESGRGSCGQGFGPGRRDLRAKRLDGAGAGKVAGKRVWGVGWQGGSALVWRRPDSSTPERYYPLSSWPPLSSRSSVCTPLFPPVRCTRRLLTTPTMKFPPKAPPPVRCTGPLSLQSSNSPARLSGAPDLSGPQGVARRRCRNLHAAARGGQPPHHLRAPSGQRCIAHRAHVQDAWQGKCSGGQGRSKASVAAVRAEARQVRR